MSRPTKLDISIDQLEAFIEAYKEKAERGDFRASWEHFLGEAGLSVQEVTKLRESVEESDESKYTEHVKALKKLATWINGQYASAPGWGGPNASKAIFLHKQSCNGYFVPLSDKVAQDGGAIKVQISFGGGKGCSDAFG